jgi:glycosyltransferase involved in cell wall biosynthesis
VKILIVNNECTIGGIETWMIALASRLRARGIECELFFFQHGPMEEFIPASCPAHFGDVGALLKLVQAGRFGLVHAHSGDITHGIAAVRRAGAKLLINTHGWVFPGWTSANCDAIVTGAQWQAEKQRELTDLPVRHIRLGIDTEVFRLGAAESSTPPIVAWVGRGAALIQKRIDKLAAIAPHLREAGLRLWLAEANGAEAVEEAAPATASVLSPLAEFWAGVSRDKMPDFYRKVAASGGVLLSTSSYEGLGLSCVEAQACGCPVVAPDVVGVNEAVRPEHGGTLYPFNLPARQVAQLVIDLVRDHEEKQRRIELCTRFARAQFSLDRMTDEYVQVCEEMLVRRRAAATSLGRKLRFLLDPKTYIEHNWTAAHSLFELSYKLAERGEPQLARVAARESFVRCPSLYVRSHRLKHLVRVLVHPATLMHEHGKILSDSSAERR